MQRRPNAGDFLTRDTKRSPREPRQRAAAGDRRAARQARGPGAEAPSGAVAPAPFPWPALVGIAIVAAVLRQWHIRHGLPDFTEEAQPFKKAFDMWGWQRGAPDLNPHFFFYPTLSFYLHFLVQNLHYAIGRLAGAFHTRSDYLVSYFLDPTPMVVAGRLLGVLADIATVIGIGVLGERVRRGAGLAAAALVTFSPTMILDSRSIFCDTLMAAFSVWALERMLAYRADGRRASLIASVVLIGLAAGSKYPAALLVLPLAWVMGERRGARALWPWAGAAAAAFAVFLATSPYVILDFGEFWNGIARLGRLPSEGLLGSEEHRGLGYYAAKLGLELGWAGTALLILSLVLTIARAWRRRAAGHAAPAGREAIALWIFLLVFGVPISLGRIEAERYLVPIIPAAAALASLAAFDLADRWRGPWRAAALGGLLAALVIPGAVAGVRAASTGAGTTQLEARRWLEAHLTGRDLLVQEEYGAVLLTSATVDELGKSPAFQSASEPLQRRFRSQRTFHAVDLPLTTSGHATVTVRVPGGKSVLVDVFPHAVGFNQMFYDPPLYEGVDYVLTSSAVRGRYEAEPAAFPVTNRFYRFLDATSQRVATFHSGAGTEGPEIRIYRLDDRAKSGIRARFGTLDPLWWANLVPEAFRDTIAALARRSGAATTPALRDSAGRPSLWVTALRSAFADRIRPFAQRMGLALLDVGRFREAERFGAAILEVVPDDGPACGLFAGAALKLGEPQAARAAIERFLSLRDPKGNGLPEVRLEYAKVLAQSGDREQARAELERVAAMSGTGTSVGRAARALLADLGGAGR